jgi:hypothetical protein
MDTGLVIAYLGIIAAVVVGMVLVSSRQRRKRASQPSRHAGERKP